MNASVSNSGRYKVNLLEEARDIQDRALNGDVHVAKSGDIIFFSTSCGDAWMLESVHGQATCLAHDFKNRPIPIRKTELGAEVEWDSKYEIQGAFFVYASLDGRSSGEELDYPTAEIQRLANEGKGGPAAPTPYTIAIERTKTGRNEACPCGSGKKYKKCCLDQDELALRQFRAEQQAAKAKDDDFPFFGSRDEDLETTELLPPEEIEDMPPDEPAYSPEIEARLDEAWDQFSKVKPPSTEQMDELLGKLLSLPSDATIWDELLHRFADSGHTDLPQVFRKISTNVPPSNEAGLGIFYWSAAEEFVKQGMPHLLPEVAAGFGKLDLENYNPDALSHIEELMISEGFELEALQLAERFLAIERQDDLMSHTVLNRCHFIYTLRVGIALRSPPVDVPIEKIVQELRRGLEDETDVEAAQTDAEIIAGVRAERSWKRPDFALVEGDVSRNPALWERQLLVYELLTRITQEAWQKERQSPGRALRALVIFLNSCYDWLDHRKAINRKSIHNLLDYLRPVGLEQRVALHSRSLIGINEQKAKLLLLAHEIFANFALRHELISSREAEALGEEIARLRRKL